MAQAQNVCAIHTISMCMVTLFTLILPFYFLLYLPLLFLFLRYLKCVVNLHNSCNESMDSTDEFSLSTGYEPKANDFYETCRALHARRRSSPTKSLLRTPTTMTLHSKTCSTKHIERNPITLYEKTCLSVCRRRQCPIERSDPRNSEAHIRTLLDNQKEQILADS